APKNRAFVQVTACTPSALGGTFSITRFPHNGPNSVTATTTTPHTFQVKSRSVFSIQNIQAVVGGNTYLGPATISGTAGTDNTTTVVTLNYCPTLTPPTITCPAGGIAADHCANPI